MHHVTKMLHVTILLAHILVPVTLDILGMVLYVRTKMSAKVYHVTKMLPATILLAHILVPVKLDTLEMALYV